MSSGGHIVKLSTCALNQHSLSFSTNLSNLLSACSLARSSSSSYLLTPELSVPGYGCEDHFHEGDTEAHCWEAVASLLNKGAAKGIIVDLGMPVEHKGARYNCRVLVEGKRVLAIRPKVTLADDGNYREGRWFTAWVGADTVDSYSLPPAFRSLVGTGQSACPFGSNLHVASSCGATIGSETCEELWAPRSPHTSMALRGVLIVGNGSGSHHELRKLNARLELVVSATKKCGGVYLYSNQRGCDGGRLYFDGSSLIVCNGRVLAQTPQFGMKDVEVATATVDLDDVRSYRACRPSFAGQSAEVRGGKAPVAVEAETSMAVGRAATRRDRTTSEPIELKLSTPAEECLLGPACWMWDYLRRSGASGFFLPLSGGADSAAVAAIVYTMCRLAHAEHEAGDNPAVTKVVERLMKGEPCPSPEALCGAVLHTCYMGTSNSSAATLDRAKSLAGRIGSYHTNANIDAMVVAVMQVFRACTGRSPVFTSAGGTAREDLALQNIQARLRMVLAYMMAQLLPWCRGGDGFLLVLGSGNVDECLRGYLTKYDCSSADLNPIGSISKVDLKAMLREAAARYGIETLSEIVSAPPTAELRPNSGAQEHSQTDEDDMGMTYEELGIFGRLRKIDHCGPVSMYRRLLSIWPELTAKEVADKVMRFFFYYSINRHKMTTVTPSYHAENYSPDDNRFDLRPFVYDASWSWQREALNNLVELETPGLV